MATDTTDTTLQYNEDELIPPDFLNQDFILKVLQQEENDKALKIRHFKVIPGTRPGDHFASIMFKAIVSYTTKGKDVSERSLVVKTAPVYDGMKKDALKDMPIFDRETKMYTKVLPEMKRIMESIGDYEKISPRIIYHCEEPSILIFEDISKIGYQMHDDFFDFNNTIKIVKKLAKFHALSFYINENKETNNLSLQDYKGVLINEKSLDSMKQFCDGLEVLKDHIRNWPGYEEISEKLSKIAPTFMQDLLQIYKPNPEPGFNVLCHGDFHIKNMMYIMNGQDIDEICFLDFQMCFWAPPSLDFIYILYETGDPTVRRRKDEVLAIYQEELSNYLTRLGCLRKGPTVQDLNADIQKLGHVEILLGLCFLPMFYIDPTTLDMNDLADPNFSKENFFGRFYKNPKFTEILKEVLNSLSERKVLDKN